VNPVSRLLMVTVLAAIAGIGAVTARQVLMVNSPAAQAAPEINGFVLQQPRLLPAFELLNGQAETFTGADFAGSWSFLYFGFTYCPDICPTAMVEMAKLKTLLSASHPDLLAEFYLVSVDPERDTPQRVQEYVTYFDDSFNGLTGDLDDISKLAQTASVIHVIEPSADGKSYEVGHSSTITLLDPQGSIRAIFKEPLRAATLADDVSQVLSYAELMTE
jgi:protein SCO1/2